MVDFILLEKLFAMAYHFIDKADFFTIISITALDELTGYDDNIVIEMADEAVEEMKAFLNTRYNITIIFYATGADRNKMLLMYGKDIALYHIHSRHHLRSMPEMRIKRYQQALQWLKDVQEQKINPVGLVLTTDPAKDMVKTGGNIKRENHQG
jgi:phage gp36-like protein